MSENKNLASLKDRQPASTNASQLLFALYTRWGAGPCQWAARVFSFEFLIVAFGSSHLSDHPLVGIPAGPAI